MGLLSPGAPFWPRPSLDPFCQGLMIQSPDQGRSQCFWAGHPPVAPDEFTRPRGPGLVSQHFGIYPGPEPPTLLQEPTNIKVLLLLSGTMSDLRSFWRWWLWKESFWRRPQFSSERHSISSPRTSLCKGASSEGKRPESALWFLAVPRTAEWAAGRAPLSNACYSASRRHRQSKHLGSNSVSLIHWGPQI